MRKAFTFLFIVCFLIKCNTKPKEQQEEDKAAKPSIHYAEYGKGEPTLVFVHGWCINSGYWDKQVDYFKDKYRIVTIDLAGHGKSTTAPKEITVSQLAAGIDSVIEYLDLNNVILIGHSMSGDINLHVVKKYPDRIKGFIGIDNMQQVGHAPTPEEERQIGLFLDTLKMDYKARAAEFSLQMLFHPKTDSAVKQRVISDVQAMDPVFSVSILNSLMNEYKTEQEVLPKMKIPLLLVVADGSIKDESSLKQYCPKGYKYWTIKDSGHYPMIERPDEFNTQLEKAITYAVNGK